MFLISEWRGTGTVRPIRWICVDIVIGAVSFEVATALNETSYELLAASQRDRQFLPLCRHKSVLRSVFNHEVVSVANHRLKLLQCFALAHHRGHLLQPADVPSVIFPILEGELLHRLNIVSSLFICVIREISGPNHLGSILQNSVNPVRFLVSDPFYPCDPRGSKFS